MLCGLSLDLRSLLPLVSSDRDVPMKSTKVTRPVVCGYAVLEGVSHGRGNVTSDLSQITDSQCKPTFAELLEPVLDKRFCYFSQLRRSNLFVDSRRYHVADLHVVLIFDSLFKSADCRVLHTSATGNGTRTNTITEQFKSTLTSCLFLLKRTLAHLAGVGLFPH